MLGLFYMGWVMISHIGAKIREFDHYVNRHVDYKTNTYVDISGRRRDNDTNQLRTRVIENNGDIVLLDKKHRVVRNVSLEERMQKWEQKRNDPKRNPIMETALKTKERRITHPICPVGNEPMYVKGTIYLDYKTGASYYQVSIHVDKEYYGNFIDSNMYFYVDVNNPFDLVRISDTQKEYEKLSQDAGRYNWLDNPQDEKSFISEYNRRPYTINNIRDKKKEFIVRTIL